MTAMAAVFFLLFIFKVVVSDFSAFYFYIHVHTNNTVSQRFVFDHISLTLENMVFLFTVYTHTHVSMCTSTDTHMLKTSIKGKPEKKLKGRILPPPSIVP